MLTAYSQVPKDLAENLKYRAKTYAACADNVELQNDVWQMCADDILFYCNWAIWTFDPRIKAPQSKVLAFVTYEFQDETILDLQAAISSHDMLIEKSRCMGASWMCLIVMQHAWMFQPFSSFLLGSRVEDLVDKPGDPRSLFWKLDFLHQHLPSWMMPNHVRTFLHLENNDNGSTMDGQGTMGDFGRGDRRSAILLDEFAMVQDGHKIERSTRDATPCRIYNSTPQGPAGAFYDKRNTNIKKARLHWTVHPLYSKGLYYDSDGKARSPWYDNECARASHPIEIAIELDIDYMGSSYQFYPAELRRKIEIEDVRPPYVRGNLLYDEDCKPLSFIENPLGSLLLWVNLGPDGKPPRAEYCAGTDIAVGSGASNSCTSVANRITGEQVCEIAEPRMDAFEFARLTVALSRWFYEAFMIWEANGPGVNFTKQVIKLGYRNIYYRRTDKKLSPEQTDQPGWWNTADLAFNLHSELLDSLHKGRFIPRSVDLLRELGEYIHQPGSKVAHIGSVTTEDPTGAKSAHGDRVLASGLVNKVLDSEVGVADKKVDPVAMAHSFAGRQNRRRELAKAAVQEW